MKAFKGRCKLLPSGRRAGRGGRGKLSRNHLVENIVNLVKDNACHGYYEPWGEVRSKTLEVVPKLLKAVPSAMLTFHCDSLLGIRG